MIQRVRTIVDCGSGAAVHVFSLSFFSRFSEMVSCTRFWVIYFYGFERGDGVEKGRKIHIYARAHKHTHTYTLWSLDKKRGRKGKKYKMCIDFFERIRIRQPQYFTAYVYLKKNTHKITNMHVKKKKIYINQKWIKTIINSQSTNKNAK
jgi:hypothetical protein